MAKFAAQGGLGLPFNGDRASFGCDLLNRSRIVGGRNGVIHRSNGGVIRSGSRWRACAVGKKKSSGAGSRAEERVTVNGERDSRDRELEVALDEQEHEFERDELSCFRGLVLDLSYRPVNIVCWKRSICLEFMEKADVLEYYDQTVSSASGSFYIPAVLRIPHLLQVVKRRRVKHGLSRKNILFRDNYTCQYCCSRDSLTIDHVVPTSRGGQWTWENLVTACERCNSRKGQKTLEETNMKLLKTPKAPKDYDILTIPLTLPAIKMLRSRKGIPEEWMQYLSKAGP